MSIITLAMAKPSYVYEEIIGKNVLISIPEGRGYTSLEVKMALETKLFQAMIYQVLLSPSALE